MSRFNARLFLSYVIAAKAIRSFKSAASTT
jgi:hypothetical protein